MIKKVLKKIIPIVLSIAVMATLISGCGSKAADTTDTSKLAPVTLKMYLIGDKPKDFDKVYGKVNEIMKKKINATLDVSFISWSDMTTKYQLLFQSGEDFDMIFTATGWGYYSEVATKNGFYELTDDKIKKYAPNIYKNEPKEAWKEAKINNKMYMIPSDQLQYGTNVFASRGDLMKKYGIDKIQNYNDLEKYMDAASKDKSLKAVIANGGGQNLQYPYMLEKNEFNVVAGTPLPSVAFDVKDTSGKIFGVTDTPQYLAYAKKMREFEQRILVS